MQLLLRSPTRCPSRDTRRPAAAAISNSFPKGPSVYTVHALAPCYVPGPETCCLSVLWGPCLYSRPACTFWECTAIWSVSCLSFRVVLRCQVLGECCLYVHTRTLRTSINTALYPARSPNEKRRFCLIACRPNINCYKTRPTKKRHGCPLLQ